MALQIKKHFLLIQINNKHIIFLLQIDRYASLDHDFNIKYFLINSNTNTTIITISVTMLTLAVPYSFQIQNQNKAFSALTTSFISLRET